MIHRHRFRPAELGRLEERIALSSAATTALVSTFKTTLPTAPGGAESSKIMVTDAVDGIKIRISGTLKENASLAPPNPGITGTLQLILQSKNKPDRGRATLQVTGPIANLGPSVGARSTVVFDAQLVKATGFLKTVAVNSGFQGPNTLIFTATSATSRVVRGTLSFNNSSS